jgi:hypothetical protein
MIAADDLEASVNTARLGCAGRFSGRSAFAGRSAVGLGAAYFVSESGTFAGTGMVGAQGWEWQTVPEIGQSVQEIIRIYRNERPARFTGQRVCVG